MKGVQTCLPFGSCLGITWSVRCCIIQTALQDVLGNYLTQLCSVPKILRVILHVPWLPSAWQKLSSKWSDAHLLCFLWQLLPWENSLCLHSEEALGRTERHAESIRERYRRYWVQCTKNILVHHGSPWLHHDPRVSFSTTAEFSYHREKYTLVLNAGHIFKYIFLLLHFLLKIERAKKEKSAAMQLHHRWTRDQEKCRTGVIQWPPHTFPSTKGTVLSFSQKNTSHVPSEWI